MSRETSIWTARRKRFILCILFCPHNSLFLSSLPSLLEYPPAGSNEEGDVAQNAPLVGKAQIPTPPPPPQSTLILILPLSSSVSINIHCFANKTASPVLFDSRGTHFNSKKLSHAFLEVIRTEIDVD